MNIKFGWTFSVLLLALSVPRLVQAENTKILPVQVIPTIESDDMVGQQLVYLLKDDIRKSSGYTLVTSYRGPRVVIRISTMKFNNSSELTVYSAVFTLFNGKNTEIYVNNDLGYCGNNRIVGCARAIIAAMDSTLPSPN